MFWPDMDAKYMYLQSTPQIKKKIKKKINQQKFSPVVATHFLVHKLLVRIGS